MQPLLIPASATITLALAFYTIGVFWERRSGRLQPRHLAFFLLGLACDATGTSLMSVIARSSAAPVSPVHLVTGTLALLLMLAHALWAIVVLVRHDEGLQQGFHRLSTGVWLFWLVPYACGLLMGIPVICLDGAHALVASAGIALAAGIAVYWRPALPRRAAR